MAVPRGGGGGEGHGSSPGASSIQYNTPLRLISFCLGHVEALIVRKRPTKKIELPLDILEVSVSYLLGRTDVQGPSSLLVPSNLPEGSLVYQIRTFPTSNVSFSLENESDNFNVDELTGIISTNRLLRPSLSKEILAITARSLSQKTSKNVTIEIVDALGKVPKLLQPNINVELPATAEIGKRPGNNTYKVPGAVVANITVVNGVPVRFAPLEGSGPFSIDTQVRGTLFLLSAPSCFSIQSEYGCRESW